jgi:hypothetical protein
MPLIINAQDYFSAGMIEPGRLYFLTDDSLYNYGMNGIMKDNQIRNINGADYGADFSEPDALIDNRRNQDPIVFPWQSPYVIFNDNPIYYSDPTGLSSESWHTSTDVGSVSFTPGVADSKSSEKKWGSWGAFSVHQKANEVAYTTLHQRRQTYLDKIKLQALNDATKYVDQKKYQDGPHAYMHAMANGDNAQYDDDAQITNLIQLISAAKIQSDAFVRNQFAIAKELLMNAKTPKDYYNAYYVFGIGLHALQDATSPAHAGFQLWFSSTEEFSSAWWEHVRQEGIYPGPYSNLGLMTEKWLEWFESNESSIQTENLFFAIDADKPEY